MAVETAPGEPTLDSQTAPRRSSTNGAAPIDTEKGRKSTSDLSASNEAIADIEKGLQDVEQPAGAEDPGFIDFEGPDDPGNPKNWAAKRRWAITVSMSSLVFSVTFASSIFSVNIGVVKELFHVSTVTSTLGVALFVLVRYTAPAMAATTNCDRTGLRVRSHCIRPYVRGSWTADSSLLWLRPVRHPPDPSRPSP